MVVATLRIHPEQAAHYEAVCREIMPQVRANSPDVVFYEAGRSRDEPHTYRVIEVYRDAAAMTAHMQSRFITESIAALKPCIAAIDIQTHDIL